MRRSTPSLEVNHKQMTVAQLATSIESGSRPVRRSTHIGNQPPAELAVMTSLPPGVEVMMVDTIQGNDKYSAPHVLRFGAQDIQLISKKQAANRVVGAITASHEAPSSLVGERLSTIHNRALSRLALTNSPVPMMEFFNRQPEALRAIMHACADAGELTRRVATDGVVEYGAAINLDQDGIFGLDGAESGAMLPLNGMMAMDVLVSHMQGADSSLQLAGPDMIGYTQHPARMHDVATRIDQASALLGLAPVQHTYDIVSIAGLSRIVAANSQHELLLGVEQIDLSSHHDIVLVGAA